MAFAQPVDPGAQQNAENRADSKRNGCGNEMHQYGERAFQISLERIFAQMLRANTQSQHWRCGHTGKHLRQEKALSRWARSLCRDHLDLAFAFGAALSTKVTFNVTL